MTVEIILNNNEQRLYHDATLNYYVTDKEIHVFKYGSLGNVFSINDIKIISIRQDD